MSTPEYIVEFIRAICPEAPELYMAFFNEKTALQDATELIADLRQRLEQAEEERGVLAAQAVAMPSVEHCRAERAEGKGGCGACALCCQEATNRAEEAEVVLDRMVLALRFYAREEHWQSQLSGVIGHGGDVYQTEYCAALEDEGKRARAALAALEQT